jgi:hypothetical protein
MPLDVHLSVHKNNLKQGFVEKLKPVQQAYEECCYVSWNVARMM